MEVTDSPSLLLQRAADKLEQMALHFKAYEKAQEDEENPFKSATEHWSRLNVFASAHASAREWMEALSPAIAAPLVAWLRLSADRMKDPGVRFFNGEKWLPPEASEALEFARLILGVSAEGPERSDPQDPSET